MICSVCLLLMSCLNPKCMCASTHTHTQVNLSCTCFKPLDAKTYIWVRWANSDGSYSMSRRKPSHNHPCRKIIRWRATHALLTPLCAGKQLCANVAKFGRASNPAQVVTTLESTRLCLTTGVHRRALGGCFEEIIALTSAPQRLLPISCPLLRTTAVHIRTT